MFRNVVNITRTLSKPVDTGNGFPFLVVALVGFTVFTASLWYFNWLNAVKTKLCGKNKGEEAKALWLEQEQGRVITENSKYSTELVSSADQINVAEGLLHSVYIAIPNECSPVPRA